MPKVIVKVKPRAKSIIEAKAVSKKKSLEEHVDYLIKRSEEKGYLLLDEIVDYSIDNNLSFGDVDELSSSIKLRGVLVFEETPEKNSEDTEAISDYSRTDYNTVYSKAIELCPELEPFISLIKTLKPAQNREISQLKYQLYEGNKYARERLIEIHLRLALRVALQRVEKTNADLTDVLGASIEGLLIGIDKYNPYENGPLGSYLSFWCFQSTGRALPTNRPLIYYPSHAKELIFSAADLLEDYGLLNNYSLIDDEEAYELLINNNYPPDKVRMIIDALIPIDYLEDYREECEGIIDDRAYYDICNIECKLDLPIVLKKLKQDLRPREYDVIVQRYGLLDDRVKTLEEVGAIYGVTRERVRQIEKKALRKLKVKMYQW